MEETIYYDIIDACYNKDYDQMVYLIENHPDLDLSSYEDFIECACEIGHFCMVKYLLSHSNADNISKNKIIVEAACRSGNLDVVKYVVKFVKPDSNAVSQACRGGYMNIVSFLLVDLSVDVSNHNMLVSDACSSRNLELIAFVTKFADPSGAENKAIRECVERNDIQAVQILLEDKRVDPSARCNDCIIVACRNGFVDIAKLLLKDDRVDPSAQDNNAIKGAAKYGHLNTVKILLDYVLTEPLSKNLVLSIAAANYHYDIVEYLLKYTNINPNVYCQDCVMLACMNVDVKMIKLLLSDVRIRLDYFLIWYWALVKDNSVILELLLTRYGLTGQILPISTLQKIYIRNRQIGMPDPWKYFSNKVTLAYHLCNKERLPKELRLLLLSFMCDC
jgi:ankyrin repeat protein